MILSVIDAGVRTSGGELQYAYFRLVTPQGERWRCVPLWELRYIPIESKEEPDVLGKQWAALRGLYNASVDFVYVAAGMFRPDHVGVAQFYGAAFEAAGEEAAAGRAHEAAAAVRAAMANFPQARLVPADPDRALWLIDFIATRERVLACLGHPDPRQSRNGLGREGKSADADEDLSLQQNEILFRGLAKLRENFAFVVTADRIARKRMIEGLVKIAEIAGQIGSRRKGATGMGFSLGMPIMTGIASAAADTHGTGSSQSRGVSDGVAQSDGRAHTDSWAHTSSHAVSVGRSETWGESAADTVSHSVGVSQGVSESVGHSVGFAVGHVESHGESFGTADSSSWGHTDSQASGGSWGHTAGVSGGVTISQGLNASQSQSEGWSQGQTDGSSNGSSANQSQSDNWGVQGSVTGKGLSGGGSLGGGTSEGTGTTHSESHSDSAGLSGSESSSQGFSSGIAHSSGWMSADSVGGFSSVGSADSVGGSHTDSHAVSVGFADSVAQSISDNVSHGVSSGTSESWGEAHTVGRSHGIGVSESEAWGTADTVGGADSVSHSEGRSHAESSAVGESQSRGGGQAFTGGFSTGLAPGINISHTIQTEDDVADRVADDLRSLESVLNQASAEGGFMTDAYLVLDSDAGQRAASALVPQAFHGPAVPQPVFTVPANGDLPALRAHALTFCPNRSPMDGDLFEGYLWRKYGTLLTAGMLAAYTAPGLFEEGTANTTQERLPPLAFYPNMAGEVSLGFQVSPETADITRVPLKLSQQKHFHTAFCADTGFGKSVAAMRMAYETTAQWKLRTIVLDFGAGWRALLNAPALAGHVDIYQLWPGAVRPFRWNPLQIGRNIAPETQWRHFADIFAAITKAGTKRQGPEIRDALRSVYLRAGVMVDDPAVRGDPEWGLVRVGEEAEAGAPAGTPLPSLTRAGRQQLAVLRSKEVDLADLHAEVEQKFKNTPPRDQMLRGVLEGILFRLHPLVQGAAAAQYAKGDDCIAIEDIGRPWGICILEGGAFLDEASKAFLLGWAAWMIYTDAVVLRINRAAAPDEFLQIFFEEANKILSGASAGDSGEGSSAGEFTAEQFSAMWRDSRKYGMWLHVITQSPSLIPPGILSSCNNLIVGQLKNSKDRDLVIAALARSEKGLVDEDWRRFIARLPVARAVAKLGYSFDIVEVEPVLFEPLMLQLAEPTDDDILAMLGNQ